MKNPKEWSVTNTESVADESSITRLKQYTLSFWFIIISILSPQQTTLRNEIIFSRIYKRIKMMTENYTVVMDLLLGKEKYLIVKEANKGNFEIQLCEKLPNGKNIRLNKTQAKMLVDSLQSIDTDAQKAWDSMHPDDQKEFRVHLGYGVYLTVNVYKNYTYYDIRRWWLPPSCEFAVPTKIGIHLTADQCAVLRQARAKLIETVPGLEGIGPCDCWFKPEFNCINCRRCNPWNNLK